MNINYFRITAYIATEDITAIFDSHGMFEKLWQFSSFLVQKGFKILEVSAENKFIEINIKPAEFSAEKFFLRAYTKGQPLYLNYEHNGSTYKAIKVADKIYIPYA